MEQVIYTASPLRAFGQDIIVAATTFVLAMILVVMSRNKTARMVNRVWLGAGAIALLGVCLITAIILISDFGGGPRQLIFTPGAKKVQTRPTKNGETHLYLVGADGPTPAAFYVPERIYDQIVVDGCYQFTYYGELVAPTDIVTEIRRLDPQRCATGSDR